MILWGGIDRERVAGMLSKNLDAVNFDLLQRFSFSVFTS